MRLLYTKLKSNCTRFLWNILFCDTLYQCCNKIYRCRRRSASRHGDGRFAPRESASAGHCL